RRLALGVERQEAQDRGGAEHALGQQAQCPLRQLVPQLRDAAGEVGVLRGPAPERPQPPARPLPGPPPARPPGPRPPAPAPPRAPPAGRGPAPRSPAGGSGTAIRHGVASYGPPGGFSAVVAKRAGLSRPHQPTRWKCSARSSRAPSEDPQPP